MEACIAYTVQVPNEEYGWSWTNTEGICRRKAQKGAYSAHVPEPGVASTHYKALTEERTAAEEQYEEAVTRHDGWKTTRAKEAWAEKLKQDKLAHQLKVEALKKEKEEAERKAEEKRLKEEWIRLEAEKEAALALEKEREQQEAAGASAIG